jgi:hypothetical protein
VVARQRSEIRLLLFVCGDDAAAAMRTLPLALLEVGARVSDLFTTILTRYRDMLVFRHAARITESCPARKAEVGDQPSTQLRRAREVRGRIELKTENNGNQITR